MIKSRKRKKLYPFILKVFISKKDRMNLASLKRLTGKSYSALGREALSLLYVHYSNNEE